MPRPRNKEDLLKAANENFEKLFTMIDQMSETEKNTPFLPEEYNWRTIAPMNREFWKKHQNTSQEEMAQM